MRCSMAFTSACLSLLECKDILAITCTHHTRLPDRARRDQGRRIHFYGAAADAADPACMTAMTGAGSQYAYSVWILP